MSSFPSIIMKPVALALADDPSWNDARNKAYAYACRDGNDPMLMAWFDRDTGKFSPSCCQCDLPDGVAWEAYGRNHGGRLRISINDDRFVFIYT